MRQYHYRANFIFMQGYHIYKNSLLLLILKLFSAVHTASPYKYEINTLGVATFNSFRIKRVRS
jgi:hypothetical protein